MKKVLTLFCLLMAVACKKKDAGDGLYHCTEYATEKMPAMFAFSGFSKIELDTIIFKTYQTGSNFSSLISTTIFDTATKAFHDTDRFLPLEVWPGEYEITVPGAGKSYRISGFHYQDSIRHYTSTQPCDYAYQTGHPPTPHRAVDTILVDGVPTIPLDYAYESFCILYR